MGPTYNGSDNLAKRQSPPRGRYPTPVTTQNTENPPSGLAKESQAVEFFLYSDIFNFHKDNSQAENKNHS